MKVACGLFTFFMITVAAHASFLPKSFRASFIQSHKSQLKNKVVKDEGTLYYSFPSNMRLALIKPEPLTVVSNKDKTWKYRPAFFPKEPGELTIDSSENASIGFFFDALHSGLKSNKHYNVEKLGNNYILKFKKMMAEKSPFKKAIIKFDNKQALFEKMKEIELVKKRGNSVVLRLENVEKKKLPARLFSFQVPKNTNVTDLTKKKH